MNLHQPEMAPLICTLKALRCWTAVVFAGAALTSTAAFAVDLGWKTFEIPTTGTYAIRYIPWALDLKEPAPVVVFLHGSGAIPPNYKNFVSDAADTAGCVLILPKSKIDSGWGHAADPTTVEEALRLVAAEVPVDRTRIAIAGHSSGGAYACRLAYTTRTCTSAVFSLSAPFTSIASVADSAYAAPIRMYYGTTDPNYVGGAFFSYQAQWQRLGVALESEILAGYGHNTWPDSVMVNGFLFLVGQRYTTPPKRWRRAPIRRIGP